MHDYCDKCQREIDDSVYVANSIMVPKFAVVFGRGRTVPIRRAMLHRTCFNRLVAAKPRGIIFLNSSDWRN